MTSRTMAAAVAAVAAITCGALSCRPADPLPLNVILLVMDTTRADRCSVLGAASPTTPCLEHLAAKGARFQDCWSPAGWTAPAHGSLLTGLLPARHALEMDTGMYLLPGVPTLAERLRAAGWATGGFSNNEMVGDRTGLDRGFDRFEPLYERTVRAASWCDETHELAADWALSQVRARRPFFLFVNDMEPHLPYAPPPEFERRFLPAGATAEEVRAGRAFDFPATLEVLAGRRTLSPRDDEILRALYDAEIAALDASIGRMLDRLEAAGVLDRTVVIVTADHGENLGDHGLVEHRFSLHRSICRVPLVVRVPGRLDDGRTVRDVVRLEDVFPTVLEACGLRAADGIDGRSLLGSLDGRVALGSQGLPHDPIGRMQESIPHLDLARYDVSIRAAYDGRFHLIAYSDGREELYDVSRDPDETTNLAAGGGADLVRLRALLQ